MPTGALIFSLLRARAGVAALYIAVLALSVLFVTWYVRQEEYIYFWDFSNYHRAYQTLRSLATADPLGALRLLLSSVRHYDYNYLAPVFLMPAGAAFGSHRLGYILAVTVTFAVPTLLVASLLLERVAPRGAQSASQPGLGKVVAVATVGLLPQFWLPVLVGYLDVAGVGLVFGILLLYFSTSQDLRKRILIGLLLTALVLIRRWYSYWAVGFIFATLVRGVLLALRDHGSFASRLRVALRDPVTIGVTASAALFIISTPVAFRWLLTDYGYWHSAYRSDLPLIGSLEQLHRYFGPFAIAGALLGLAVGVATPQLREMSWLLITQFAATFWLFTRTQDFGWHHYYLVVVTIVLFFGLAARWMLSLLKTRWLQTLFVVSLVAVSLSNFLPVFHPGLGGLAKMFPQVRRYPQRRTDMSELRRLVHMLETLTRDSDAPVYVLASGLTLNDEIVRNACYELGSFERLGSRILDTHHVDKLGGFPYRFFSARFVVVSDPIDYHLRPKDQRIVGLFAEAVLKGRGIGASFTRLPFEFRLERERKVYIYSRNGKFETSQVKELVDLFTQFYPGNRRFEVTPELIRDMTAR